MDKIDALLQEYEEKQRCEPVCGTGDGWHTSEEWANIRGVSRATVGHWLRRCMKAGLVEVSKRMIMKVDGGMYPVPVYRFKNIEDKKK